MSASSSFLRLILSLRPSASRLAAAILACICSLLISAAILDDCAPGELESQLQDGTSWDGDGIGREEIQGGRRGVDGKRTLRSEPAEATERRFRPGGWEVGR